MTQITERLTAALADRYRLERHLGEGGMATVYLAHDEKHDRKVAVKILKPELAAIIGGERFVNEIKVTANLQHPNILPLYDSGEADGFLYYVMPHVEGESLRHKLDREKQLSVEDTVALARAVAGALQYAHDRGVVHRDIKPENILLQSGQPLVADFGIALAVSQAGGTRLTETGLSLGTPHYMSPEQAMGDRELDARTDVYSLGAMTYEMLVGEPPYVGNSAQAIVARILSDNPAPVRRTRSLVPENVDAAVQRALAKSPADRFSSAARFAEALANPAYTLTGASTAPTPVPPARTTLPRSTLAAAAVAAVAVVAALIGWFRPPGDPVPVVRYSMAMPADQDVRDERGSRIALAPDGSRFAYIGPAGNARQVWLRSRSQLTAQPLSGTDGAVHVFFSPDGGSVGYLFSEVVNGLRVVSLAGGPPLTVEDSAVGLDGAAWADDGLIYYDGLTAGGTTGIMRIRPGGGDQSQVTTVDTAAGEADHIWPTPLPGSKGLLFTIVRSQNLAENEVAIASLPDGVHRTLVRGLTARYVPSGHLVYVTADGGLLAAPFDLGRLELTGEPVALAEGIRVRPFGAVDLTVSETGTIIYAAGDQVTEPGEIVTVDRAGRATPVDSGWAGDFRTLAVAPNGRQLAVSIVQGGEHQLWVKQLPRGPLSKLTFNGTTNYQPVWTPDSRTVQFVSNRSQGFGIYRKRADGSSGAAWVPSDSGQALQEFSTSSDGRLLLYTRGNREFRLQILDRDSASRTVLQSEYFVGGPAISPDGRWLAYMSAESGRTEVYVRPFPELEQARWQVSVNGGGLPRWSPGARELFYVDFTGDLVAVEIVPGESFSAGQQQALFSMREYRTVQGSYDVLPDGSGFVMIRQNQGASAGELVVVEGFAHDLERRFRR